MGLLSGVRDFVGLDLGTTAIRVVQLSGSGENKVLGRYGFIPIDPKISSSEAAADKQKVAQSVRELMNATGLNVRNVVVGLPSQRVFTTVVDIDRLSDNEIAQTIQLQADSLIPTPMDEAKIDWAVVGDSPADPNKVEVLLSSVTNEYVEGKLDMLESMGLNVIAFEPDTMAITRSLVSRNATGMHLILDIGNQSTDLVACMNGAPRLTRSIPTGLQAILKSAMQNLNIDAAQAEQFVTKFGLSKDKLEGQIYNAIIGTIDVLVSDVEKSIKFVGSRYPNNPVERIIVTGGASTLPEFPLYVANKFGVSVEIGNAWRNVSFQPDKQNELLSISNHFSVAVGLAERVE